MYRAKLKIEREPMKLNARITFLAAAAVIAGSQEASAQSLPQGIDSTAYGAGSTLSINFSKLLVTSFNTSGTSVQSIAPASVEALTSSNGKYSSVAVSGTLQAPSANSMGDLAYMAGGIKLMTEADDLTNTGGELSISNLSLDATGTHLLADVSGANNVAARQAFNLFDLVSTGLTSEAGVSRATLLFSLEGFDYYAQALGLTEDAMAGLRHVTDRGTLTLSAPVPEPSSVWLMALGAVGVGLAGRARSRRERVATAG
jgi:hypothetical protein